MTAFFISYRRSDSTGYAGRLVSSLESRVGPEKVFRDVEDIKPGDDFVEAIERNLKEAGVFLVIIGKDWLESRDGRNRRRLDNPKDYVRLEIETALRLGGLVIPVLVGGALMPDEESLPEAMSALAKRQAIEISDSRWEQDVERLLEAAGQSASFTPDKVTIRTRVPASAKQHRPAFILLGMSALAVLLLFMAWHYFKVPDISGNWYFERGDFLLIRQDGDHFAVERTDPAMQTTYEKGNGIIKGRRLEFDLEPVYSQQYRLRGELEMAWDGESMKGRLQDVLSDEAREVAVTRQKPKADR
ncbi:MAG: toll/interleukin-1 receptor domain-containing protein [Gammaproteobacteria bacterium]